jgi:hypothetical protein
MYPVDDSKKCSIYNNSFLNDLKPYLIKDTLSDNRVSENSTNQCVLEYVGLYQKTKKSFECEDWGMGVVICRDEDDKKVNTQGEFVDDKEQRTNEFGKVDIRINEMKSIINEQNSSLNDCWLPAFVKNDNNIHSKEVISGNVIAKTHNFLIENEYYGKWQYSD